MPKLFGKRRSAPEPVDTTGEAKRAKRELQRDVRLPKSTDAWSVTESVPNGGAPVDFAQVGEQVAKVLESAKEAAERMTLAAYGEAEQLRKTTEEQAREELEQAKAKAERADADAAEVRAAAEQQSQELREQADEYATATREAAEAKATALLARAERRVSAEEDTSRARRSALDEGVARTEERLRQLVVGLHELAGGLEELVSPPESSENGETDSFADHMARYVGESRSRSDESETT